MRIYIHLTPKNIAVTICTTYYSIQTVALYHTIPFSQYIPQTPLNSTDRLLCPMVLFTVRYEMNLYIYFDAHLASERYHMSTVQTVIKRYVLMNSAQRPVTSLSRLSRGTMGVSGRSFVRSPLF